MDGEIVKDSGTAESYSVEDLNRYARSLTQELRRLNSLMTGGEVRFMSYTKDDLINFLQNPSRFCDKLVEVSRKMYQNSPQYRRLIQYYAGMPMWPYILEPAAYNPTRVKAESLSKQYYKAAAYVEKMNIKHEMRKALAVAMRDGILYGVIRSNSESWFIQRIDPRLCRLSSIIDGCWIFSVNMSRIREEELYLYPDEFYEMWRAYKRTGDKWQEVPDKICFCLKGDETVDYVLPPFAAVLPNIIELEAYRELAEVAKEIGNYKLVAMRVPLNDKSELSLPWETILQFYQHLANALPDYVGAAAVPMELDDISFRDSSTNSTSDLEEASRDFWSATGTSPLLFGDASNNTASALRLSIRADEEIVFGMLAQCERLINHHLKFLSGAVKFRINLLPVTVFNQEQMVGFYKEAATYGLPTKTAYGATVGLSPTAIAGICTIENDILNFPEIFVPLSSSYTMSGDDEGGRPAMSDDEIGEAGEITRANDSDANKG